MDRIKAFLKTKNAPVIIYVTYIVLLHLIGYETFGDDVDVIGQLQPTLFDELHNFKSLYMNWSSRLLVNVPIYMIMHFDYRIRIIVNILMLYVIYKEFLQLCFDEDTIEARYIVLMMLSIFPFVLSVEVGWMVTSMSYIWPAALALVACKNIKYINKNIKPKWNEAILFLLCTIYAAVCANLNLGHRAH